MWRNSAQLISVFSVVSVWISCSIEESEKDEENDDEKELKNVIDMRAKCVCYLIIRESIQFSLNNNHFTEWTVISIVMQTVYVRRCWHI